MAQKPLNIILIGKTGCGKSSTGNFILRKQSFKSKGFSKSATKEITPSETIQDGRTIKVVDTPGLFDTDKNVYETALKIQTSLKEVSPGPHVFVIVIDASRRYTKEEKKTQHIIQLTFGEKMFKHGLIIFTHEDKFDSSEELLRNAGLVPELQTLIKLCGRRCITLNSVNTNGKYKKGKIKNIMDEVNTISKNGEVCYTEDITIYTEALKEQAKTKMAINDLTLEFIDSVLRKQRELHDQEIKKVTDDANQRVTTALAEGTSSEFSSGFGIMTSDNTSTYSRKRKRKHEDGDDIRRFTRAWEVVSSERSYSFVEMVSSGNFFEATQMFWNGDLPKEAIIKLLQSGTFTLNETQKLLNRLAGKLKSSMEKKIKHVWVGYRKRLTNVPVFVLISYNNGFIISAEDIPESYRSFECVIRHESEVTSEAREINDKVEVKKIVTGKKDRREIKKTLSKNIDKILKCHSNVEMIGVSSVRSIKYGQKHAKLIPENCIVVYVHVKGIIPYGENEIPRRIGNYPVDVREGKFVQYSDVLEAKDYHQHLEMGCQIVRRGSDLIGTIGGFLDLRDGGVGVLTCAHVVLAKQERAQFLNCNPVQQHEVLQSLPWRTLCMCQPDQYHEFGTVHRIVIQPGSATEVGIDAAIVKITMETRLPVSGRFPRDFSRTAGTTGYGTENPIEFSSGICKEIRTDMEGCEVVKFGATTGITRGLLAHTSLFARRSHYSDLAFPLMYNQMEITPLEGFDGFAQPGDSGALVFMAQEGNRMNLAAIGIVVGGTTSNTTVVTPILSVLRAFNLANVGFKPFIHCPAPKRGITLENLSNAQKKQGKQMKELKKQIQLQRKEQNKQNQRIKDLSKDVSKNFANIQNMIQNISNNQM